jgi:Asp-tRNA(Asn)/Glu-tRNA(Gln) amidotransferase A subunit family amidase
MSEVLGGAKGTRTGATSEALGGAKGTRTGATSEALGAAEAARRIRAGTLTSEAIVRACLDRIAARERDVGAWTCIDPDRALAAARDADRRDAAGPLHGVPIAAKDIIDTFDMPTALGFAPYSGRQPSWDAACVAACRRAGAIVLGKTVTTEFAYFAPGKTRNPHDLDATPGGSSSGSAAAVADGMVPIAFGSQTAGSLVRPAAFCGIYGYKASHGEFSLAGIRPLSESLDSLGVMARCVEDLQLMRDVLLNRASTTARATRSQPPRLALYRTLHWQALQPAARAALESAVERLRGAGARVEDIEPPASLRPMEGAQRIVMAYEAAHGYLFEYMHYAEELSAQFRALCDEGRSLTRDTYLEARKQIAIAQADFARAFSGFDGWIAASALGEAPPASEGTGDPLLSRPWTALQAPAVALPAGRGPRGLPVGVQLLAPKGSDDALLATAQWVADHLA